MESFESNTVVIGGGPGGYAAAIRLAQLGIDTTLIEKEYLGGTCLNVGCIPSKALLHVSSNYKGMKSENEVFGIKANEVNIDWQKTIQWKDGMVQKLVNGIEYLIKTNRVRLIRGTASLSNQHEVNVIDVANITCKNIILATGSKIFELPNFKFNHTSILDSTDLLSLKQLPKSMIILGGGIIGMELGTVYTHLGVEVTVIEMGERILLNCEKEASLLVEKSFKNAGGSIITKSKATKVIEKEKGIELFFETNGSEHTKEAELLAVAVGRIPNTEHLNLDQIGIEQNQRKIVVNDQLQTSISHIYAIGDLIEGPMLAHKATAEGVLAAEIIHGQKASREDIQVIPDVVYTKPEVASVGLNEEQAKKRGLEIKIGKFPFSALGRAQTTQESNGYIKYIANAEDDRIIGSTIVSNKASELISQAAFAIEMGATLDDIALTVHPHPTFTEGHMEAAAAGLKKAIHIFNK